MKSKFKIGDKVKLLGSEGFVEPEELIIKDVKSNRYIFEEYADGETFREEELELVSTSEQQAVNKFKEELKEQIEHILQYEIDAAFPSSNDFKNCIEKILKLLE